MFARMMQSPTRSLLSPIRGRGIRGTMPRPARMMQSLCRNRDGSALIEATLVVPVLLTLCLGVFEFSWLFHHQQLVSAGIRDAARYAAKSATPCGGTTVTDAKNLA